MQMKIAIVGVKKRIDEILASRGDSDPNIELVPYCYEHYTQAVSLVKSICDVEGILFTGKFPYQVVRKQLDSRLVLAYLEYDESCLIKVLFAFRSDPPQKVSIDTISRDTVKKVYNELGMSLKHIRTIQLDSQTDIDGITAFHLRNYRNMPRIRLFTCFYSVYEALRQREIPCELITHTCFSIKKGVNHILNKIYFRQSSSVQPAVGVIQIDGFDRLCTRFSDEFRLQRLLLRVYGKVLDFQDDVSSFVVSIGSGRYYFISTRFLVEKYTDNYRDFPLLFEIFSGFNLTVSVGVGYGTNPMNAFHHAKEALVLAQKTGNAVKILTAQGDVITPGSGADETYRTRWSDEKVGEISRRTGIGPRNIARITGFLEKNQRTDVTVYELSEALHITTRSGSRLMSKLVGAGLAQEIGMEQIRRGRPRKVFRIALG